MNLAINEKLYIYTQKKNCQFATKMSNYATKMLYAIKRHIA
jgi:hypothetical protein